MRDFRSVQLRGKDDKSLLCFRFKEFKNFQVFSNKEISYILEVFQENGLPFVDRFGDDVFVDESIVPSYLKGLNAFCTDHELRLNLDFEEVEKKKAVLRIKFYSTKTQQILGAVSQDLFNLGV